MSGSNAFVQLCAALERGEHYVLNFAEGNSSAPGATASLLVRQLLTSTRHGPLTQAEVLACASVLTNLCASHADEVTAACDGLLERWAIERLDLVHGANTSRRPSWSYSYSRCSATHAIRPPA